MGKYYDLLPDNNLEKKYFRAIADDLSNLTIVSKNFGDPLPDIDGEKIILMNADEAYRIPDEVNDPSVKMIFKQYCRERQHQKLRPIPLGPSGKLLTETKPIEDRKYDVTFVGQIAPNRANLYNSIPNFLSDDSINCFFGFYKGFNRGISATCYSEILSETKIAVCPHGTSSPETFRFFESMALLCVVIAPPMPDNWIYRSSPHIEMSDDIYRDVKNVLNQDIESLSRFSENYYSLFVEPDMVASNILRELGF